MIFPHPALFRLANILTAGNDESDQDVGKQVFSRAVSGYKPLLKAIWQCTKTEKLYSFILTQQFYI